MTDLATDPITAFFDRFGMGNTSGARHEARAAALLAARQELARLQAHVHALPENKLPGGALCSSCLRPLGAPPDVPSPALAFVGHGYTCGWCGWGRDRSLTLLEYQYHVEASGHHGEKR